MNDIQDFGGHTEWGPPHHGAGAPHASYRKDLHTYLWGLALALILTAVPFALVYWHAMTVSALWIAIGIFALIQAVVHFLCFLHVNPPYEHLDETLLVLFTVLIVIIMAGGTVWILGNLHARMY